MNHRLQKKCVIASAGLHLTLLVILFVGPAFLSSRPKSDDRPMIDFVPLKTIDEAFSGGGNPNARPPAPQPPQPQTQPPAPQPTPTPQRVPEPPAQKAPERDPDAVTVQKKKGPVVNLNKVTRKSTNTPAKSVAKNNVSNERSEADERQTQFANAAKSAARRVQEGSAGSTSIEMPGPGGGGVPYANFLDAVKRIYSDAWIVPDGVTDDEATATVSVTIARDGTVTASRLVQGSGNALADQSVEMVLRRVRFAVPLPDGAKESERTVRIKFNVKAKKGLG
jgi:TonB family protein